MQLYNYFRSSASFRVRIVLALKGLSYEYLPVHLARGEQLKPPFATLLPNQAVPVLQVGEQRFTQSLAIMEYLNDIHPQPPLLPADAAARARVRALAQDIACEIHPLNNLRVLKYLVRELGASEEAKNRWYQHWTERGLADVEQVLATAPARYCFGDTVSLADCCLVPQIFNAQRFNCRLDHLPHVMRVFDTCMQHPAFQAAEPKACPDFE